MGDFPLFFQYALYMEPSHSCSVASSTVRQSVSSILKGSPTFFGTCNKISRCSEIIYVKLGIFQGQGMHRKRHAVIMSVTFCLQK